MNSQLFTAAQGRGAFLNGKRINGQLLSEFHTRQLLDLHGIGGVCRLCDLQLTR